MSKLWLVAKYEYVRNVFKKSFIFVVLSVPLILALSIGLGWLINRMENPDAPAGYVDHAGVLTDPIPAPKRADSPNNPSSLLLDEAVCAPRNRRASHGPTISL